MQGQMQMPYGMTNEKSTGEGNGNDKSGATF